jgi:hypothetical protein
MFNSLVARRLMRSRGQAILTMAAQRQMSNSALLVPLPEKETLPWELRSQDLTEAEIEQA